LPRSIRCVKDSTTTKRATGRNGGWVTSENRDAYKPLDGSRSSRVTAEPL